MTLRDKAKPVYPNCWENTGGAVLAGETSLEGALRELREETGLAAQPEALRLLDILCFQLVMVILAVCGHHHLKLLHIHTQKPLTAILAENDVHVKQSIRVDILIFPIDSVALGFIEALIIFNPSASL